MARRKISNKICCISGCGRTVEILMHMLCKTHSIRFYRLGDAFAHIPIGDYKRKAPYKRKEKHQRSLEAQAEAMKGK